MPQFQPGFAEPPSPSYIGLGKIFTAVGGLLGTLAGWVAIQQFKFILHAVPVVGDWIYHNVERSAVSVYHSMGNLFAQQAGPFVQATNLHAKELHNFIVNTHAAIATHDSKIATTHETIGELLYGYKKAVSKKDALRQAANVHNQITNVANNVGATMKYAKGITKRLDTHYWTHIIQRINQDAWHVEYEVKLDTAGSIQAQTKVYQHYAQKLATEQNLVIPERNLALPVAVAAIAATVASIATDVENCVKPMCSDWNAAKKILEGLLLGFGDVGALAFLADAVQHPESLGKTVAGYADEIGNLAVSTFYDTLGLAGDRPPPPTS